MGLFRRRRAVDLEARSEQLGLKNGDLLVMGQLLEHGADLTKPRHTLYYLYFPSEDGALGAAQAAKDLGFRVRVAEPDNEIPDWSVVCEHDSLVLDPDTVRSNTDHFDAIAADNDGEYDGWEAAVTTAGS